MIDSSKASDFHWDHEVCEFFETVKYLGGQCHGGIARDTTETYVALAWDRAVPDDHASRTFQNVFAELVL